MDKNRAVQWLAQAAKHWQTQLDGKLFEVKQLLCRKPAEQHGMPDQPALPGLFDQIQTIEVGEPLVTQNEVVGFWTAFHGSHGLAGRQNGGQQKISLVVEQYLGGDQLKGMILHQQDSQVVLEHEVTGWDEAGAVRAGSTGIVRFPKVPQAAGWLTGSAMKCRDYWGVSKTLR